LAGPQAKPSGLTEWPTRAAPPHRQHVDKHSATCSPSRLISDALQIRRRPNTGSTGERAPVRLLQDLARSAVPLS